VLDERWQRRRTFTAKELFDCADRHEAAITDRTSPREKDLLQRRADRPSALRLYLYSLAYLALLFCAMVADAHL